MKKVLLAVMIFTMSSFAQMGLDVAGEFAMPMGDFADGSGMGFGGTLKAYYPINEQLDVTGKVGYLYFMIHEDVQDMIDLIEDAGGDVEGGNITMIPILLGARYKMTPEFYGLFEIGMTQIMMGMSYEQTFMGQTIKIDTEISEMDVTYAVGAGYIMNEFDFSVFYNSVLTEDTSADHLGIRVGYKFM